MKILVVDDSKAMRMIVLRTMRQAGYTGHDFMEATNGQEALNLIKITPPDLILSDWNMPEMNGIDLLRALQKPEWPRIKFGFVTSEGTPDMRLQATEAGALFLITKPFTADTFKASLDKFFST